MSHQDTVGHTESAPHHQALNQAPDRLLSPACLSEVAFRAECTWTPRALIFTAILWAWSDQTTLTERLAHARKVVIPMAALAGTPARSDQAFLKLLRAWTGTLTVAPVAAFRRRMQADLGERSHVHGFPVFGVDGSRLELPRTESDEQRFAPASARRRRQPKPRRRARTRASRARRARQEKADSPQMWLTTMSHVGAGLPWDWRVGPSDSSERGHLRQMIDDLPTGASIAADAGFAGYETRKAILASDRHLLIRVGANVRLLRGLGYAREADGVVDLRPGREAARSRPPLVLRLVVVHNGRHPVHLVTSVLEGTRLSGQQVAAIYALRRGVELFYRHFKQAFERRKLRSHAADNAELEATWSLLGLWAMSLHAQAILKRAGIPARRASVAKLLRAYRRSLREYRSHPDPGESSSELLKEAVIDPYQRKDKSSRDDPRKKHGHATGAPEIRRATRHQINAARKLRDQLESRLTA